LQNRNNQLYLSALTCWEVSLKYGLGKLTLEGITPDNIPNLAQQMGIELLALSPSLLASTHQLAYVEGHKDPFDRALVWLAIREQFTLVSCDQKVPAYQEQGLLLLE
jgi:PIN domain nuclease of toxin-antitoxin system